MTPRPRCRRQDTGHSAAVMKLSMRDPPDEMGGAPRRARRIIGRPQERAPYARRRGCGHATPLPQDAAALNRKLAVGPR